MLKKIPVDQLRLGMHIKKFCGSWVDHPFWRENFVLKTQQDLDQILACPVQELWIDTEKGKDVEAEATPVKPAATESSPAPHAVPPAERQGETQQRTALADEVQRARKICSRAKSTVTAMFHEARLGKAVDKDAAGELVEDITASVLRNSSALISLARLRSSDDYTYMHSVAVCALMIALAKQLDLDDDSVRNAGLAGLLHDMGKAMIPPEILNKPGRLTAKEFELIKTHPLKGHEFLSEIGTHETALDVSLHHHEKIDGSGYPNGLRGDQLTIFAKMGAICDVYDAITTNRPYKSAWDPSESIRKMTEWSPGHFDENVFHAFVKCVGIFPTGSLVKLSSGRLGVVVEQNAKTLLSPTVRVFFSTKSMTYLPPEQVMLSWPGCNERIISREDPEAWGIKDLPHYWAS